LIFTFNLTFLTYSHFFLSEPLSFFSLLYYSSAFVVMPTTPLPLLRVAIVGGGPGGLAAAISLLALPNVEVTIYEQARELREIGAGIQIGYNCWRILELLGAAEGVKGYVQGTVVHRSFSL
jgi:hypothetical protein